MNLGKDKRVQKKTVGLKVLGWNGYWKIKAVEWEDKYWTMLHTTVRFKKKKEKQVFRRPMEIAYS